MKVGDLFETEHLSKWGVTKVYADGSFEAMASDGVQHRFTADKKFVRENYDEPHPYDFKRPWSERESEDHEKIELGKKSHDEFMQKRAEEIRADLDAQEKQDEETERMRETGKRLREQRKSGPYPKR